MTPNSSIESGSPTAATHLKRWAAAAAVISSLFLFQQSVAFAGEQIVLGVISQVQCQKDPMAFAQLLFSKQKGHWVSLSTVDAGIENIEVDKQRWTVALDGRALGTLRLRDMNPKSLTSRDWNFSRDKLFQILDVENTPRIKNGNGQFEGWCGTPSYRPLVIVSKSNVADPEQWRPFLVDDNHKKNLLVPLRLVVGRFSAVHCPKDMEISQPWDFTIDDLVAYKGYRSSSGREIVSIGLDRKKANCDGPTPPELSSNWFLIEGQRIEFLGRQMELIDAGDYDNDGRSELLFWYSSYNNDGYVLISNQLREMATYVWKYH